ncbi:hypothetical protein VNI00_014619 [Paramarasmius palmivorus]|uniref:F-box domain-containing protein n=1 Tax=Paramarasmius palmivorus TaxID=297713 RepID=A0AAW0BRP6_9AGAR
MTSPEVFQSPPVYTIRCDKCWSNFSSIPHWKAHEINSFARCKPSHIQILQARDAIVNEEEEIRRYDAEIKRLNRIIKKLKAEQSLLRKQLAVHRSWIAPIQQLPSEILMEIFQYACLSEDYTLSVTSRTKEIRSVPLTISYVSSRWRGLVKGQPNLWTSISVDLYRHRWDICPLLRSFLENSKQKPLSIEFRDSEIDAWTLHYADSDYRTCHLGMRGVNVFSLLMEESYRVESLSAQISWEILENEQLNNLVDSPPNFACRFPILRELRSFQDPGFDDDGLEQLVSQWFVWNGLSIAPHLRVLSLHALSPDNPLPYHRLTRLELLWDDDPEYLLGVLSNSPCLEELSIQHFRGSITFDEVQFDPVKLTSLRSLTIGVPVMGVPSINALFSILTLPSLRTLEIRHIAGRADTVLAPIYFSPGDSNASPVLGAFGEDVVELLVLHRFRGHIGDARKTARSLWNYRFGLLRASMIITFTTIF